MIVQKHERDMVSLIRVFEERSGIEAFPDGHTAHFVRDRAPRTTFRGAPQTRGGEDVYDVIHTWGAPALVLMPRLAGCPHHLLCPAGAAHVTASADGAALKFMMSVIPDRCRDMSGQGLEVRHDLTS